MGKEIHPMTSNQTRQRHPIELLERLLAGTAETAVEL